MNIMELPGRVSRKISWEYKKWSYKREEARSNQEIIFSHVTYPISGNVGDTVLSQCVRREFELQIPDLGWNLIEVNRPVTQKVINKINDTKALIIGGGGLFMPDTNKNDISGWVWAISQELLNSINVPIIIYSVGYNYFHGQEPDDLFIENLSYLCEKSSFIGLRNHGSVNAVKSILPSKLSVKVTYQPCTATLIRRIYGTELPERLETKKIAFNMAFDRQERRYRGYKDQICMAVAQAAKQLEQNGYEIYVVLHCMNDDGILPYMQGYQVNTHVVNLSRELPMQVYQFYNEMDCVLGMRGHAQMIPFGLNCDIISLGTHDKLKWFLEDIEAEDWYIDVIDERDHLKDVILDKFHLIHEVNGKKTQERLIEAQEKLWNITQDNMKEIMKTIF